MSRELDDLIIAEGSERENYQPGSPIETMADVQDAIESFLESAFPWREKTYGAGVRALYESVDAERAQIVLDRLIEGLNRAEEGHQLYSYFMLNPFMQKFYDQGKNHFSLDFQRFIRLHSMGGGLHGTEERPLEVRIILPPGTQACDYIGQGATYCQMSVVGAVESVGMEAKDSTFYLDRVPLKMGKKALRCNFFLEGTSLDSLLGITDVGIKRFKERGNRLYSPDGHGGWQEVRKKR